MRIAQALYSNSWGETTPEVFEKGVGGREGAMLRLSREWARAGHEVTNFVNVKQSSRIEEPDAGYHEYVPFPIVRTALSSFKYDACVVWEAGRVYDEHIAANIPVRLFHMQVAHIAAKDADAVSKHATGVVALSDWAGMFLQQQGLEVPEDRQHVLPNGVDLSMYPRRDDLGVRRDGGLNFVYSSSPDRGLVHLLKAWPRIYAHWPGSTLYVAYGAGNWARENKWSHGRIGEVALMIERGLGLPGVVDVGRISGQQLARLQLHATAWLYPCDTIQPTETGCITAVEAGAAGTPMVITDADCLGDEFGDCSMVVRLPFDEEKFLYSVAGVIEDADVYRSLALKGREMAESRDWKDIAQRWIELIDRS